MKINFKWITTKSRERFAKIDVRHFITLQTVESFLCKMLAGVFIGDDGPEWSSLKEIKSRASIDAEIRKNLKWHGDEYPNLWNEDIGSRFDCSEDEVIELVKEKAKELIEKFYPEFKDEIAARENSGVKE